MGKNRDLVPGGRKRRTNDQIAADNARDAAAQPGIGNFFKPPASKPATEPPIPRTVALGDEPARYPATGAAPHAAEVGIALTAIITLATSQDGHITATTTTHATTAARRRAVLPPPAHHLYTNTPPPTLVARKKIRS